MLVSSDIQGYEKKIVTVIVYVFVYVLFHLLTIRVNI